MNGISALVKEKPENSLHPSDMWARSELSPDIKSASALTLTSQAP